MSITLDLILEMLLTNRELNMSNTQISVRHNPLAVVTETDATEANIVEVFRISVYDIHFIQLPSHAGAAYGEHLHNDLGPIFPCLFVLLS